MRLRLFDGAWEQVVGTAFTRADRHNYEDGATTTESLGTKVKLDYQSTVSFVTPSFAGADHALTFYAEREDRHFRRSEEHTSELQSIMRNSYAVFCLKKKII